MNILLYSLAPPDRRTNRTHQPGAWPIPPPIHQQMTGQLVQSPTHHRVPAQQPCLLCDTTISIPTRHGTNSLYRLWAKTEPLGPGNSQQIHGEDEVCYWRGQVCNLQGAKGHNVVLQLKKVSSPCVQARRLGIPRHIGYQNDMSVSEVVTLQTGIRGHLGWCLVSSKGLNLLVAHWQIVYRIPIVSYFSYLWHAVQCLLSIIRTIVITDLCACDCPCDHLVWYIY